MTLSLWKTAEITANRKHVLLSSHSANRCPRFFTSQTPTRPFTPAAPDPPFSAHLLLSSAANVKLEFNETLN